MQRRRYLTLVGATLLAGCGSNGGSTPTSAATATPTDTATATPAAEPTATTTPTSTPGPSIQVRVVYPDTWSGDIQVRAEGSIGTRSIADRGEHVYDVDPEATDVVAEIQKDDSSGRTLTVQLLHNGEVIDEDSTDEAFGEASVQADFS